MDRLTISAFVIGLLVFGALNTLATKLTFQIKAEDLMGHIVAFQKPWFGVYRMFQGMAFVLLVHGFNEVRNCIARRRQSGKTVPGGYVMLADGAMASAAPPPTQLKGYLYVAAPAALDLFGTVCTYVGLIYNSSSVWQMFRGSMVIFATLISVVVLKRRMSTLKWLGVGMCVLAICIVGIANINTSQPQSMTVDPSLKVFGMGMILFGMLLQGGQIVVEEFLMKGVEVPPTMVVGMEGVWGCILMVAIVFPIVQSIPGDDVGGSQENLANDFYMLAHSQALQKVVAIYLFSVFTYNIAGMMVTYYLSAVHRTMLEASRTAVIWAVDLLIHYLHPDSSFGEVWSSWSFVQLFGFVLLVLGQATYSEIITWGISSQHKEPSPKPSPVQSYSSPKAQLDLPVDMPPSVDIEEL